MARRDLVLLGVLVAVVFALAALVGGADRGGDERDPRTSTYLTGEAGAAALFWTLQELGLPAARREGPLVEGAPPRGSLAFLAPSVDLSPAEVAVVMERVRAGGLLVFAASPWDTRGGPVYDSLGLVTAWVGGRAPYGSDGVSGGARPHPWTEGVARVSGFRSAFADSSALLRRGGARVDTLLATEGRALAVTFPVGEGRVLALADARPLTNGALRESGAATLVARAAAAAGDTLWFDEHHHGFGGEGSMVGAFSRALGGALPRWAWLQLALVCALLLYASGRRFGAPHPPPPAERRSPLEHVEALAGAYRQAEARRTARRLLVAGLARRLGRRPPPDERAAAELLRRLATGGAPDAAAAATEVQREWTRGTEADLAGLARGIDRILDEVRR